MGGAIVSSGIRDIVFEDVTLAYRRRPAVHHLTGCFRAGSMTAVVGPNGAGKSTVLKGIAGVLRPESGALHGCGCDIAYLPQQAEIDRRFPIDVAQTVACGAWKRIGAFGQVSATIKNEVSDALTAVGLEGFERRSIGSLSAGQFQRVLFARLLLQRASVILLDEPFTAIDARTTADLLALVQRRHAQGVTVIAVLHDFAQVREYFPQTLLLAREPIGWGETAQVLTPANLGRVSVMSERWDAAARVCEKRA